MTSASAKKTKGVYKVTHKVSGHFYIGSSKTCELRFYQHHRSFERGDASKNLQRIVDQYGNQWSYEIVEEVLNESDLKSREEAHQIIHKGNPLYLNTKVSGSVAARGLKRTVKDGNAHVRGLLGKNLKDPNFSREEVVTFISPDGKTYKVRSIKRFARQHGLSQGSMNSVAQGKLAHHKGWRLPTTPIERTLRPMQKIDVTVVSPTGKEYRVTDLTKFCKKMKVNYHSLYNQLVRTSKFQKSSRYCDKYGRGWFVKGKVQVWTITDTKTGKEWKNVTVLPKLEETLGLNKGSFRKVVNGEFKRAGRRYTITLQGE